MDIAIARGGASETVLQRRQTLADEWLGGFGAFVGRVDVRFGLIEDLTLSPRSDVAARIHETEAGRLVRSVNISAGAAELPAVLANLVSRPLPWLRRLSINQTGVGPLDRVASESFVAQTPNLEELILDGDRVMVRPGHPNVSTLRLAGESSLVIGANAIPNVTTLDLAFDGSSRSVARTGRAQRAHRAGLLNPRTFPNLRKLDLSRNEFVYPTKLASNVGVFPFIDAIEEPDRIVHLRLPSLRTKEDAESVFALLERVPTRTIEFARLYAGWESLAGELEHPRLSLPPPRPWPPRDLVSGRDALTIKLPQKQYGEDVALSSWIEILEHDFDGFSIDAKAAWVELWGFLDGLGWESADGQEIVQPFRATTLLTALETVDDHRSRPLREALRALPPAELEETRVTIKRYWGW